MIQSQPSSGKNLPNHCKTIIVKKLPFNNKVYF